MLKQPCFSYYDYSNRLVFQILKPTAMPRQPMGYYYLCESSFCEAESTLENYDLPYDICCFQFSNVGYSGKCDTQLERNVPS